MRILIHISDLHFDRVNPAAVEALVQEIQAVRPHLIVVSGDLTQRARVGQFRMAEAFLKRLPFPQLIVPGNHDVPLYNVYARFFTPFENYKKYIQSNLEPVFEDEEIIALGLCTPRSFTISEGKLRASSITQFKNYFNKERESKIRIAVSHHPLNPVDILPFSPDLLLAGHLHLGSSMSTAQLKIAPHRTLIAVQGGTSTSSRHRGEGNTFNFLRIEKSNISIEKYQWTSLKKRFTVGETNHFSLSLNGWNLEV